MKKLIQLFLSLLILLPMLATAQNVEIKLKLKKGDEYTAKITMDNTMKTEVMGQTYDIKQLMDFVLDYKVLDKLPNGNYKMEQSYVSMKMKMDMMGQEMYLDSENPDSVTDAFSKLKEFIIGFEVSPLGEVTNLTGMEELMNSLAGDPKIAQSLKGMLDEKTIISFFQYIPVEK